jgi:hypothetical protein
MAPEEPTSAELGYRMTTLEKRVDTLTDLIERRFDGLSEQVKQLAFVRVDVYAADTRLKDREILDLKETVAGVRTLAMWALGAVCSTTIGAIILAIIAVSGVFK